MKNTCICPTSFSSKNISVFFMIVILAIFTHTVNAQSLYKTVSASRVDISSTTHPSQIISGGSFIIKDGQLDDISDLKFVLSNAFLKTLVSDSLIGNNSLSFKQTHVMVLPIMGMVHFVGVVAVGDQLSTASFQLAFHVNKDETISITGSKTMKLGDFIKAPFYHQYTLNPDKEINFDLNFTLSNNKTTLVASTSK